MTAEAPDPDVAPGVRRRSRPMGDAFMLCPGSTFVHPPAFLPVWVGPKTTFTRCPLSGCEAVTYYVGCKWADQTRFGLTKAEIARQNPSALVL